MKIQKEFPADLKMKQDKTPMASTKSEVESDTVNNIENQVKMTKAKSRYHKAFYFSKGMPMMDRINIFKSDFPEFATFDDSQSKKVI